MTKGFFFAHMIHKPQSGGGSYSQVQKYVDTLFGMLPLFTSIDLKSINQDVIKVSTCIFNRNMTLNIHTVLRFQRIKSSFRVSSVPSLLVQQIKGLELIRQMFSELQM